MYLLLFDGMAIDKSDENDANNANDVIIIITFVRTENSTDSLSTVVGMLPVPKVKGVRIIASCFAEEFSIVTL